MARSDFGAGFLWRGNSRELNEFHDILVQLNVGPEPAFWRTI